MWMVRGKRLNSTIIRPWSLRTAHSQQCVSEEAQNSEFDVSMLLCTMAYAVSARQCSGQTFPHSSAPRGGLRMSVEYKAVTIKYINVVETIS